MNRIKAMEHSAISNTAAQGNGQHSFKRTNTATYFSVNTTTAIIRLFWLLILSTLTSTASANDTVSWNSEQFIALHGDINGDGRDDLLLQPRGANAEVSTGSVTFQSSSRQYLTDDSHFLTFLPDFTSARLLLADINGDGKDDLVTFSAGEARVRLSNGNGFAEVSQTLSNPESLHFLNAFDAYLYYAGDFNGDGRDEFIALSDNPHRPDRAHVLMQTEANGQLNVHQSPGEEAVWAQQQSSRLIIADYNNDGRDDIFAVARKANDPHWLVLSSDKGRFSSRGQQIRHRLTNHDWDDERHSIMAINGLLTPGVELLRRNNRPGGFDERGEWHAEAGSEPGDVVARRSADKQQIVNKPQVANKQAPVNPEVVRPSLAQVSLRSSVSDRRSSESINSASASSASTDAIDCSDPLYNPTSGTEGSGCSFLTLPDTPTGYPTISGSAYKPLNIGFTVGFAVVADATYYELYAGDGGLDPAAVTYTKVYSGSVFQPSFSYSTAGHRYYKYKACNSVGCSGLSPWRRIYVYDAPEAIRSPVLSASSVYSSATVSLDFVEAGYSVDGTNHKVWQSFNGGAETLIYDFTRTQWQQNQHHVSQTLNEPGSYVWRAQACSPSVGCGPSTSFTITVTNRAPVAVADTFTHLLEDTPAALSVLANDTDPDGHLISLHDIMAVPLGGQVVINGNQAVYTPYNQWCGDDRFTYRVKDAFGAVSSAVLVSLTVNCVNDAPYVSHLSSNYTVNEDTSATITYTLRDFDSDVNAASVSVLSSSNPAVLPLANIVPGGSGTARTLQLQGAAHQHGSSDVTFRVSDGTDAQDYTFNVVIHPVNDLPVATGLAGHVLTEDTPLTIAVPVADVETPASALTLTSVGSSNYTVLPTPNVVISGSGATRSITLTPAANQSGSGIVWLQLSDGTDSATYGLTFTVNPVNDTPTAGPLSGHVLDEDDSQAITLTVNDVETPASEVVLRVKGSSNTALVPVSHAVISGSGNTRTLTLTPAANQSGSGTIWLGVHDGTVEATYGLSYTVNPVNDAPTVSTIPVQVMNEDETLQVPFTIADIDTALSQLSLSATAGNPLLVNTSDITFSGSGQNRTLTITPLPGRDGETDITVHVNDGTRTTSRTFHLTVNGVNDAPTLTNPGSVLTDEDHSLTLSVKLSDSETPASQLAFNVVSSSNPALLPLSHITVSGNDAYRTLTLTPTPNTHGFSTVTLSVSDGELTRTQTFTLTVRSINDLPLIQPPADIGMLTGQLFSVPLVVSDVETPLANLTITASAHDPSLISPDRLVPQFVNGQHLLHVTAGSSTGHTLVDVRVSDGSASRRTSFNVQIDRAPEPPTISGEPPTAAYVGEFYEFIPDANDRNINDTLSFLIANKPGWASFDATTGKLSGTPAVDDIGTYATIIISVTDGSHTVSMTPFSLNVQFGELDLPESINPENDALTGAVWYGALEGEHRVENDGSFTYRLPIEVPVGINNLQPKLAISYNANRRNSILGFGWTLEGFSTISRCNASLIRDGYISGIADNDRYKYCLDGTRLIEVSDNEFRTEEDTFQRISFKDNSWFVTDKHGTTATLGGNINAKLVNSAENAIRWYTSEIKDVHGNYMVVNRDEANRLTSIDYTKHDSADASSQRISFGWENRDDVLVQYMGGAKSLNNQRLVSITTYSYNKRVSQYQFHYQTNDQTYNDEIYHDPALLSRLFRITRCFNTDSQCTEPVTFDWTAVNKSHYRYQSNPVGEANYQPLQHDNELYGQETYLDVDGDGEIESYTSTSLVTDASFTGITLEPTITDTGSNSVTYTPTSQPVFVGMDINADGFDDIVRKDNLGNGLHVYLSDGEIMPDPTGESNWSITRDQLSFYSTRKKDYDPQIQGWVKVTKRWSYKTILRDLNGDGLVDIMRYPPHCLSSTCSWEGFEPLDFSVAFNTGNGFSAFTAWIANYKTAGISLENSNYFHFPDFNGDGLLDLVFNDGTLVYINDGTGAVSKLPDATTGSYAGGNADFNGDGLTDYFVLDRTDRDWLVRMGTGDGLTPPHNVYTDPPYFELCDPNTARQKNYHCALLPVDFNKDGYTDIVELQTIYPLSCNTYGCPPQEHPYPVPLSIDGQVYLSNGGNAESTISFSEPVLFKDTELLQQLFGEEFHRKTRHSFTLRDYDEDGMHEESYFVKNALQQHRIIAVHQASGRIDIEYRPFVDNAIYQQTAARTVKEAQQQGLGASNKGVNQDDGSTANNLLAPLTDNLGVYQLSVPNGIGGQKTTQFFYENSRSHRLGYGFLGFEKVTETTQFTPKRSRKTVTHYAQEATSTYKLTGKPVYVATRVTDTDADISDRLIKEAWYNWQVRVYQDDADNDDGQSVDSPHWFTYLKDQFTVNYELNTGNEINRHYLSVAAVGEESSCEKPTLLTLKDRTTTTDDFYDSHGSVKQTVEKHCDSFGVMGSDKRRTDIQHFTDSWVLDKPETLKTIHWVYDSRSQSTERVSHHETTDWSDIGLPNSFINEPDGTASEYLKTTLEYTNNGLEKKRTETVIDYADDGIDFINRTQTRDYSRDANGYLTINETNWLGHQEKQRYDPAYGQLIHSTDPNDLTTQYTLDPAGRTTSIRHANGSGSDTWFRYVNGGDTQQWYQQTKAIGETAIRVTYDSLGREVERRERGLTGRFYFTSTHYDTEGNVYRTSQPYAIGQSVHFTRQTFDVVGRLIKTTFPDDQTQTQQWTEQAGTSQVTFTNALGHKTLRQRDAAGRNRVITDALNTVVRLDYDPDGNLSRASVTADNETETISHHIDWDKAGNKIRLIDPDSGTQSWQYNALGFKTAHTNAVGQSIRYVYDKAGRQIKRTDIGIVALQTIWDSQPSGVGKAASYQGVDTDGLAWEQVFKYDDYGNLAQTNTRYDGFNWSVIQHYDAFNRPVATRWPNGVATWQAYNQYGVKNALYRYPDTAPLWQALDDNGFGHITKELAGNGVKTTREYTPETGLINLITASDEETVVQDHRYSFDAEGNLRLRSDVKHGVLQHFCYDSLSRLTDYPVNDTCSDVEDGDYANSMMAYDPHGNILKKDNKSYRYGEQAGPHAVTTFDDTPLTYNTAGQRLSGAGHQIQWHAIGKPTQIDNPSTTIRFHYGPLLNRIKRTETGDQTTTSWYIAQDIELLRDTSGQHFRITLDEVGVLQTGPDAGMTWLHRDHLGSIVAKTTADTQTHLLANTPWGARQITHWDTSPTETADTPAFQHATRRGFTNHEHIDGTGLIHMNGRLYDTLTGRFISPDPWIQDPENTQSWNRYSYVWNNPLRYTDPTGEWVIIAKWIADAVAIGLAAYNAWDAVDSTIEAGKVLADDNASTNEKAFAVASAAASIIDPTPGNAGKKLAGHTDDLVKQSHHLDDAASNVQKNQDALSGKVDGVVKESHVTNKTSLKKSEHAKLRSSQGRSTSQAHSDLQKAKDSDIFVQDDGRFVIRGPNGREHIIENNGELVTTVNGRSNKAHLTKVGKSRFRASETELSKVRSFLGDN